MKLHTLLDGVTETGDGTAVHVSNALRQEFGLFQIEITGGTATVLLQGRLSAEYSWTTIGTYSASGADRITLFPSMRASVSAESGATITAGVAE